MKQSMHSNSFSVNMNQQFPLLFLDGAGDHGNSSQQEKQTSFKEIYHLKI